MRRHFILLYISLALLGCDQQTMRRSDYSVHGIDVSHYQKYIDWQAVADQNIHFAFIKATEGETFRDSLFCSNWEKIKDAGIRRGAYHFFRPTVPAEAQARNFIEGIELGHGDLAPVLDVEVMDGVSETDMRESVKKWLNLVESTYKIKPILYTNQKFFNRYLAGHFQDYPVWIARYHSRCKPELKASHEWQFWQYGNRGRLKGINGDVDFNVFYGSLSDLEHFCLNRPAPLLDSSKIDVASSNP